MMGGVFYLSSRRGGGLVEHVSRSSVAFVIATPAPRLSAQLVKSKMSHCFKIHSVSRVVV